MVYPVFSVAVVVTTADKSVPCALCVNVIFVNLYIPNVLSSFNFELVFTFSPFDAD